MPAADVTISGNIADIADGNQLHYVAAAPPDFRCAFSGSGLPFSSPRQAFHMTPNSGVATVTAGRFSIALRYPNSYYELAQSQQGGAAVEPQVLVPPTVFIMYTSGGVERRASFKVGDGVPYRLLYHPNARDGAEFYDVPGLAVRSQEQVLRDSAYPETNKNDAGFWGARPPL